MTNLTPKKYRCIGVGVVWDRDRQRILIDRRLPEGELAGYWEFPGGKIELGESPEEALARELSEELGIEAEIGELKLSVTHSYNDVGIVILFYEVLYWKGEPKAKHHLMLEWIYPEELKDRSIPDANKKVLEKIFKVLGVPWRRSS